MIVFGSPLRYIQGPGARAELGREVARLGSEVALILDPAIEADYGPAMRAACNAASVDAQTFRFSGDCTPQEVDRLAAHAGAAPVIVAAGGGKCIDAGKAVAHRTDAWVVTVPTIASTDAPTSHNYVLYDTSHKMLRVEKMKRNPALVIVDTEIIARAPKDQFLAGVGDAIGKVYEVEACANAGGINVFGGRTALTAIALARFCHDLLLADTAAALAALDNKMPDAALDRVIEATVLMSGLAFESGGLSIAHSMTRGLTAVSPYVAAMHGFQVAYANLVQIRLEARPEEEIMRLADFYLKTGLPRSLHDLAGTPTKQQMTMIAELTLTAPHVRHFPRDLSADDIRGAMEWVEAAFGVAS